MRLAKQDKTRGPSQEYSESLKLNELREQLIYQSFEEALKAGPEETISLGEPQPIEKRWAGAAFENCPSPDDLPLPAFLNSSKKSHLTKKHGQDYAPFYAKSESSLRIHKKNRSIGSVPFFYQRKM